MRILKYSRITYFFIVLTLVLSPLGLADGQNRDHLMKQYRKAVEDARTAEPDEICTTLTAVVSFNKELVWRENNGEKQVLVVTWTRDYYNNQVGQTITTPRDIWVTAVPQLKHFCQALKMQQKALQLRLEQLLGLPPDNGKTMMVEIWVSPSDLFRPSPDPAITDHEAELDFPNSWFMSVAPPYIEWFHNLKASSYGKDGYPWTRLGYTYDWGNPGSEVGLSEFVIRSGAAIGIHSSIPTAEYCQVEMSR